MPGWCADRTAFTALVDRLSARHRVLALDWRGHGESQKASGDFGFHELVADARAVIDAAGLTRFVPVATAHAGFVAIELRRALGAKIVPGVVMLDWMVLGAPPPFLDALRTMHTEHAWQAVREGLFERWTTGVDNQDVLAFVKRMGEYDFAMWSRAAREITAGFQRHPNPLAALELLGCKALHAYAQPDEPAFHKAQQDYATAQPWFSVARITAKSHFPTIEAPDQVAGAIERFVLSLQA